ncbi:hypothetical protein [Flavobacterium sp. I3-2]|uniref:hypothetical protein n=1 Tax=Flavobacterium sp. I3-2 TaxID=2748319 RepID=UPI0015ADC7C0|nr:hypothetical protein [Flavobacterium sp. I3-2]
MKYLILISFLIILGSKTEIDNLKIKSITKTINGNILEIKEFDENQNLVFEKHNQIDFNVENSIIFMTAYVYDTINLKTFKYYANSNTKLEYSIDSLSKNMILIKEKKAFFKDVGERKKYRNTLLKINNKNSFLDYFNSIKPNKIVFDYEYSYSDSITTSIKQKLINDTIIIETIKKQDDYIRFFSKIYTSLDGRKLKEFTKSEDDRNLELIYNDKEQIIFQKEIGQYYKFIYRDDKLIRKKMYHGKSLAFMNEYFYKDDKIIKEIKYKITESEYFSEIPKVQTVLYKYKYY